MCTELCFSYYCILTFSVYKKWKCYLKSLNREKRKKSWFDVQRILPGKKKIPPSSVEASKLQEQRPADLVPRIFLEVLIKFPKFGGSFYVARIETGGFSRLHIFGGINKIPKVWWKLLSCKNRARRIWSLAYFWRY